MTREDIIRIAREAGFETRRAEVYVEQWTVTRTLERFAALVAAAERGRIKEANAPEIEKINAHIEMLEERV